MFWLIYENTASPAFILRQTVLYVVNERLLGQCAFSRNGYVIPG